MPIFRGLGSSRKGSQNFIYISRRMSKNMSWISLEEKNRDEGKNKNKIVSTNKKMNELQMQMTRKKRKQKKRKNFFKRF